MNAPVVQCRECEKAGIGLCAEGTCCRNTPADVSPDSLLYRAAINCPHHIVDKSVTLHFDPAQPGNNALDQLALRLLGAMSASVVRSAAIDQQISENAFLRSLLRPFAELAQVRFDWAAVEYCVEGDSEKRTLIKPDMHVAFNKAADEMEGLSPVDTAALARLALSNLLDAPGGSEEPGEVEQVIACLGDDAVKLRDDDQYVEMADNMDDAARLIAILAARPTAGGAIGTGDRLTDMKANSIVRRDGYEWTGVVLCSAEGDRCIVESSAVRWLSKSEAWTLMHPAIEVPATAGVPRDSHPVSADGSSIDDSLATTRDLAMLVRQLVHALGKANPEHRLVSSAVDYLKRKGLAGSPLREGDHTTA